MNESTRRRHRLSNGVQSLLLLTAMAVVLGALGWVVAGGAGVLWALVGGVVLVLFHPRLSPRLLARLYGARPLDPGELPGLFQIVSQLTNAAGLSKTPSIYYVPSALVNAFTTGGRAGAVIALTDGMLRQLSTRELAGVLAHEMSHIQHNDMWVMGLADLFGRMTSAFATFGQLLILLNLPLLLFSSYRISWLAIAVLVFAPALSALLQLALSRSREYAADLGAIQLTRDPRGLASALAKMSRHEGRWFEQVLLPGRRSPEPSLLRSHPPTPSTGSSAARARRRDERGAMAWSDDAQTLLARGRAPAAVAPVRPVALTWSCGAIRFSMPIGARTCAGAARREPSRRTQASKTPASSSETRLDISGCAPSARERCHVARYPPRTRATST